MISTSLRRLICRLRPANVKGVIESIDDWAASEARRDPALRSALPPVYSLMLEAACAHRSDFSIARPATSGDYILAGDMAKLLIGVNRGVALHFIRRARVLDEVVLSPGGRVFAELLPVDEWIGTASLHPVLGRVRVPPISRLPGTAVFMNFAGARNYYHWVVECLPAMRATAKYRDVIDHYITPTADGFHAETMSAFGIDEKRLVVSDNRTHFQPDMIIAPRFNSGWTPHAWLPDFLCEWLLGNHYASGRAERIYVSRRDATSRRATNEDEVADFLKTRGFRIVALSGMTVADQARLFANAETIVSIHGAGLTNVLFCRPGATLLEIFPHRWTPLCYFKLAEVRGMKYRYMNAEEPSDPTPPGQLASTVALRSAHLADLTVPMAKLREFVSQL